MAGHCSRDIRSGHEITRAALSTMTRRAAKTGEGWMRAEPRRTTGRKCFTTPRKVKWASLNGEKREFYVLFSQLKERSRRYTRSTEHLGENSIAGHSRAAQQSQLRFEHISYRSRTTAHLLGLPGSGSPGVVGRGSTNMSVDEKNAAKKEDSWRRDEAEATPWCTRQLMGFVISNKAAH